MKRHEIMRKLIADGWFIDREGARHTILRHLVKAGSIQVPRGSGDIPMGTAGAILKNAGVK